MGVRRHLYTEYVRGKSSSPSQQSSHFGWNRVQRQLERRSHSPSNPKDRCRHTTTAFAAALETYELLEHTTTLLPPRQTWMVKRVCGTWNTLITGSKKIACARARCLVPLRHVQDNGPVYHSGADIRYHTVLDLPRRVTKTCRSKEEDGSTKRTDVSVSRFWIDRDREYEALECAKPLDFATSPPV